MTPYEEKKHNDECLAAFWCGVLVGGILSAIIYALTLYK